jgi:hypothetical protein
MMGRTTCVALHLIMLEELRHQDEAVLFKVILRRVLAYVHWQFYSQPRKMDLGGCVQIVEPSTKSQ